MNEIQHKKLYVKNVTAIITYIFKQFIKKKYNNFSHLLIFLV